MGHKQWLLVATCGYLCANLYPRIHVSGLILLFLLELKEEHSAVKVGQTKTPKIEKMSAHEETGPKS